MTDNLAILAIALLLDALIGDPDALWRRVPHPIAILGSAIGWFDRMLNNDAVSGIRLRLRGSTVTLAVVLLSLAVGYLLQRLFAFLPYGWVGTAVVGAVFLAGRSLFDHIHAVDRALRTGGLTAGRAAVSKIVGRDPALLDEAGVCRSAIESGAENFSDAVVAPAFWFALLGLPGLIAYKAINTADSMIGYRNERYRDFGWASARLDDLVNLPASRLAGALLCIAAPAAGGSIRGSFAVMLRDAGLHRSPNAGWPEAATGGALGLAFAGPRQYRDHVAEDPYINPEGRRDVSPTDIRRWLRLYVAASACLLGLVIGLHSLGVALA